MSDSASSSCKLEDSIASADVVDIERVTRCRYSALVGISFGVFIGSLVVHFLAAAGNTVLFPNSTILVTEHFLIEITPSSPTYAFMWNLTHAWHLLWLIYVISIAIRSSKYGSLSVLPGHISPYLFPFFIVSCLADSMWLILRNHFVVGPGLGLLSLSAVCAVAACIVAHRQLNRTGLQLLTMNSGAEIWWTRCLVLNGLALHVAWVIILGIINSCIVMAYVFRVHQSTSTTYGLCALAVFATLWSVSDWYYLDIFTRYTISPNLALVVTLAGTLVRNLSLMNNNTVLNIILLGSFCVYTVARIVVMVTRHRSKPIFKNVGLLHGDALRQSYGTNKFVSITVS